MKYIIAFAAAVSLGSVAIAQEVAEAPAASEAAAVPELKNRSLVKTADGKRVGTIDRIIKNADGAPHAVQIIYKGRFIAVPVSTLSTGGNGLVTSLTGKDLSKL